MTGTALAERIGAAVTGLPDVAGLTAGPAGRVVTFRVGEPFAGVAVRDDVVEIAVVARAGRPLPDVAAAVRRAAAPLAGDRTVDVLIDDIREPDEDAGDARS
ncbi:hypothetical protein [Actinomadura flavalba]|uniref:hypothetical protein n=1 Tax=Actinomadura flavalba TaxID=1120938 RepID=UPI000364F043|nr:hypothetical protein [Actinomadura flavalba]